MGSWQFLDGWRFSWLAAVRSGQPYTLFAPPGGGSLYNRRADYVGGPIEGQGTVPGGVQLVESRGVCDSGG